MLVAGPASAMRNSFRPDLGSDEIWASPPKMNNRMLRTCMPCLSATRECASSWASTERNNRQAAVMPINQYCGVECNFSACGK